MGKKVKYTGSKLLGEELKKLRGGRTLDAVAALSKNKAIVGDSPSIAAPTISQIETGVSMPSPPSLWTLSRIYRVSIDRLQGYVIEERLARTMQIPDTLEAIAERYEIELRAGNWYDGLAYAMKAERLARDERERVRWRACRALCTQYMGLREQAMLMLLVCIESPVITKRQRCVMLGNVADMQADLGLFTPAAMSLERALATENSDLTSSERAAILRSRGRLLLVQHEVKALVGAEPLDRARSSFREAKALLEVQSPRQGELDLNLAIADDLGGRKSAAARSYASIARTAASNGDARLHVNASINLGSLRRREGKLEIAERMLTFAAAGARERLDNESEFEACFELVLLAAAAGDQASKKLNLKRCIRLYPQVVSRTPNVWAFERLIGRTS